DPPRPRLRAGDFARAPPGLVGLGPVASATRHRHDARRVFRPLVGGADGPVRGRIAAPHRRPHPLGMERTTRRLRAARPLPRHARGQPTRLRLPQRMPRQRQRVALVLVDRIQGSEAGRLLYGPVRAAGYVLMRRARLLGLDWVLAAIAAPATCAAAAPSTPPMGASAHVVAVVAGGVPAGLSDPARSFERGARGDAGPSGIAAGIAAVRDDAVALGRYAAAVSVDSVVAVGGEVRVHLS